MVDADQVVRKPDSMPWEEAGVLTASGQTAHTALQALGIGEGDTVLIHAARWRRFFRRPARSCLGSGSSERQASEIMIIFVHWVLFLLFMVQAL